MTDRQLFCTIYKIHMMRKTFDKQLYISNYIDFNEFQIRNQANEQVYIDFWTRYKQQQTLSNNQVFLPDARNCR